MPGSESLVVRARVAGEASTRLDVDLRFEAGITAVMGHSGAGKSTLLATIAGLIRPAAGHIALGDHVLFDEASGAFVPPHQRRVGLVFQSLALFPHLSVLENVAYGTREGRRAERQVQARAWLARTRVEHLAERAPGSLSGGEAQRVAIARALASEPRVLLLDEPFSALDQGLRAKLRDDLGTLIAELGLPAVLATHHAEDAEALGAPVIELSQGRVAEATPRPVST